MNNMKNLFHKLTKPLIFSTFAFSFYFFNTHKFKGSFFNNKIIHCLRTQERYLTPDGKTPEFFEEVDINQLEKKYPNLIVVKSKAVDYLIGMLRDKTINTSQFRKYSNRIIRLIIEETLAFEANQETIKESPMGFYKTNHNPLKDSDYCVLSILRSGNSMVEQFLEIIPGIYVGVVLVQRNENSEDKRPIFFFEKLPKNVADKKVFLLDPLLATGGSASATIEVLKSKGVKEENIFFLNMISCEEGIEQMFLKYPHIKILTAKVDKYLLPNKYIAPGIGDFGDRFYGTD
jgi:uracil phosphoribosyltransferase